MKKLLLDPLTPVVLVLLAIVLVVLGVIALALSDDYEEWRGTEDPACIIRESYDLSIFHDDTVTRTRYCKEA